MSHRVLTRTAVVPPFDGVALVDYRDRIELAPLFSFREFTGMGRVNADEVGPRQNGKLHPFFAAVMGGREIWVIVCWRQYEDGSEEPLRFQYLDPEATEATARKSFDEAVEFMNTSKDKLEALARCLETTEDDRDYIETRFPDVKRSTDATSIDDKDLHHARLKVLSGMQPRTAQMLHRAEETREQKLREALERDAVEAFFADMANSWTPELIKEWQRHNPVGTEWLVEFARSLGERKHEIDPINHELVLNWLRRKYNLLTAEELSALLYEATGEKLSAGAIKKRRERLGLITKRQPGPRPNSEG